MTELPAGYRTTFVDDADAVADPTLNGRAPEPLAFASVVGGGDFALGEPETPPAI